MQLLTVATIFGSPAGAAPAFRRADVLPFGQSRLKPHGMLRRRSRTGSWRWLAAVLLAIAILPAGRADAGVVGETSEEFAKKLTDDPTEQKEIGEAVDNLAKLLPDAREGADELRGAPRGARPARGVSGPFEELVVNFDKLACAAWIVSYRDWYLGLILKDDPETPPETLAAAQNLLNKVIFGCRKIIDPDTYEQATAPPPAQPQPQSGGERSDPVDVIDGVLVMSGADRACWDRCRDKWSEWKGAEAMRMRAEQRLRAARLRASTLLSDTIPWGERRIVSDSAELRALQARRPRYPRRDPDLDRRIAQKEADIANLRTEVARHKADLEQLRQEIAGLERSLPELSRQERAALQAYLDCLETCADNARATGNPSRFAETTRRNLRDRLPGADSPPPPAPPPAPPPPPNGAALTPEQREARLKAIQGLRTGEADSSGTNVTPAFGMGRDPAGEARNDAALRADESKRRREQHDRPAASPMQGRAAAPAPSGDSPSPPPPQSPGMETGALAPPPSSDAAPQANGVFGTWRLQDTSSGVAQVTISDNGKAIVLRGMGPDILLEQAGNSYFGEGATLFGKPGHQIRLQLQGSALFLEARNSEGGSFSTTMHQ